MMRNERLRAGHVSGTEGRNQDMERQMQVMVISVDLLHESGCSYLPIEDPIPWDIAINQKATEVLASCPNVLESMIKAIRCVVALDRGDT
jgi:hypothetical protein